jgi:hypothetical protein
MAEGDEVFLGLNQKGVIVMIVLFVFCTPLFWIPFVIDSMKAANKKS